MFFDNSNVYTTYKQMDKLNAYILSVSVFFLIFFFSYPHPFLMCAHKIALSLCL